MIPLSLSLLLHKMDTVPTASLWCEDGMIEQRARQWLVGRVPSPLHPCPWDPTGSVGRKRLGWGDLPCTHARSRGETVDLEGWWQQEDTWRRVLPKMWWPHHTPQSRFTLSWPHSASCPRCAVEDVWDVFSLSLSFLTA